MVLVPEATYLSHPNTNPSRLLDGEGPFRLDYVVKISTLRRLGGVRVGYESIAISIVALGMVDAVAMLPLAVLCVAFLVLRLAGALRR